MCKDALTDGLSVETSKMGTGNVHVKQQCFGPH
jgi:hypothetical protein